MQFLLLTALALFIFLAPQCFAAKAKHVVLVVCDGLRPDFVNETNTPTLARLARDGVFFANHHAVYPSSTEVNGATLATGAYPNRTGIVANREYRPAIDPLKRTEIESWAAIAAGDNASGGHYLRLPTLPEILRGTGKTIAIAGTKPVVLLWDRNHSESVRVPAKPKFDAPNTAEDAATVRSLVALWEDSVPAFSLLWLSDPDVTQHAAQPGAAKALQALKAADDNVALMLRELDRKGVGTQTDVLIVSDHGFSTVFRSIDVADELKKAGWPATPEFKQPPHSGEIMVVGNGGSVLFYVIGHDQKLTQKLVNFLQQQDFTAVLFTRESIPGTFPLAEARLDSPDAPDILMSLRWTRGTNDSGVAGMIASDWVKYGNVPSGLGRGGHGGLSPYDMRNTLIAAGPDFKRRMVNPLPSGNADVAPTILAILGVKPPEPMDGRVLREAFVDGKVAMNGNTPKPIELRPVISATTNWRQELTLIDYDGALYIEGGSGSPQK
jgi:predicted AlkP superfamily pyrophosphatase or phosphodiesterase